MTDLAPWWQTTVVYQVYPRSFADGDGDGVGDLAGLTAQLDHLAWLGVGAVWLSPIFPSPMADFGYDVADYCDVDPVFGDLAAFDALVAAAHARGIKVMLDWVPNHTSDQHPWFVESRSSRDSAKRSWYVWRDGPPDGTLPNNWLSTFTGRAPAWSLDERTGQVYLHCYLPQQPDLNWDEPEVEAAMHDVLRFWLDRGVDGFRADVVHLIGKDLGADDDPDLVAKGMPHTPLNDVPVVHERLRGIRRVLDAYPGGRPMVGEVFLLDTERVAAYFGHGDELHLCFNFPFLYARWDAATLTGQIDTTRGALDPVGAWPTWVLSNHDTPRHRTRHGGSEARARAAAVLLLTLRGTPFLYQGEELGLENAEIPPERKVDPGNRDGCRAPLPWTSEPGHGWPTDPWLPFPPEAGERSVAAQRADEGSVLHLYRALLHQRAASPALQVGSFAWLPGAPDGVLAYERANGDERWWVLVSTFDATRADAVTVELPGPAVVVLASSRTGEGGRFAGTIGPDEALLLRPG